MSKPLQIVILILRIISDLIHYLPREIQHIRNKRQKKHKKTKMKKEEETSKLNKEEKADNNEINKDDDENDKDIVSETKKSLIKID